MIPQADSGLLRSGKEQDSSQNLDFQKIPIRPLKPQTPKQGFVVVVLFCFAGHKGHFPRVC